MKNKLKNEGEKKGIIISLLESDNIQIDMDKQGCMDLIEILQDLLNTPECTIVQYDNESGWGVASGILNKNSLGLICSIRNKYCYKN